MKIGLILPGTIWYAPYVRIYTRILDKNNVSYQIISWNRDGQDSKEGLQYEENIHVNNGSASFSAYRRYIVFIKKVVKENNFDKLIVFGPQMTCLLSTFLLKNFKNKFLIDYRDLSIEQKTGFRQLFALMTKMSYANIVSSPGFICCLPKRDYYLSHNFDVDVVRNNISMHTSGFHKDDNIDILTIGGIRDYSSNIEVVKALANESTFTLRFIGRGGGAKLLEDYCKSNGINNVSFKGFYQKYEEADYIKSSTFMNIFYPRIITHDTALSNRFYSSLIYRKPMIVTKDTIQGEYAEKFNVGVALADCSNLKKALESFLQQDYNAYVERCDSLLQEFLNDQNKFEKMVCKFIDS